MRRQNPVWPTASWTAILAAAAALPCSDGLAQGAAQKLPTPSGRVTYRIKTPMMDGTTVFSWIQSGKRFRQDTTLTAGSGERTRKLETWAIGDGTYVYMHPPMTGKEVRRMKMS